MANDLEVKAKSKTTSIESMAAADRLPEIHSASKTRPKLGQLLVERGLITAEDLAMVLSQQMGMPYIDLSNYEIKPEVLELIPESIAQKYNVIPLTLSNKTLVVAIADPTNVHTLEALAFHTKMRIEPVIAVAKDIQAAVDRNYKSPGEIEKQFHGIVKQTAPTRETMQDESIKGAPAVRALDLIIDEAIKNRTSDIHIEPEEDRVRLRYRIDGVMHEVESLPLSAHAPLISRLKILANMNIADHRPQDGQFSVMVRGKEIDIRVATIATACGEMGTLRILDKSLAVMNLSEIGFLPENLNQFGQMLRSPFGMILISGPTGSGKTTTLYASINNLNHKEQNIITIEDPVEYRLNNINQIQVNPRAKLSFSNGLRAIMRHDPDVILVGEIRDPDTASVAIQAATTGHLVLASIHANDAVGVLIRLLDLGVESFLVSTALIGIVAQRMVRRVCPHCQYTTTVPAEEELAYFNELREERKEFVYGKGCNSCTDTGYLGRIAVLEILYLSDEIRRLLSTGASAAQIRAQANEEGMISMRHDGMLKVKAGITTPSEILRSVFSLG